VFHADPRGILALVAVAMCWALALVLFRVGSRGSVARKLALLLVAEGVTLVSSGSTEFLLGPLVAFYDKHPWYSDVETIVHAFGDSCMLALYPPFLAAALQTPLTRTFSGRNVRWFLAGAAIAIYLLVVFSGVPAARQSQGPWFSIALTVLFVSLSILFGFAFVASLQAWYASTGAVRKRARIFALAFGIRDICWGYLYARCLWQVWSGEYLSITDQVPPMYVVYTFGTFIAVPLIAYGILRTQLFDIDLRIRWTIKQSTLAAAVIAIVYAISEGANRMLSNELGNFAGLIAAAVVVFFLAPLQRFAERVASVAMPNTHDTPEYAAFRKLQVYQAAVSEALPGGIGAKEKALLQRLRDSLGIAPADAIAIERDLSLKEGATAA